MTTTLTPTATATSTATSTTTSTAPVPSPLTRSEGPSIGHVRPQRFSTLVRVEWRKMTDTRSARVLLAAMVLLAIGLLGWKISHHGRMPVTFENYNLATTAALAVILPLVGLLAMTSEWSQRTALTTFTMSPRRLRVFVAKLGAAIVLSTMVLAVTTVLTLAATALGGAVAGESASYAGIAGDIRSTVVTTLIQVVFAAAIGALIALTPVAVATYLVLPTVWAGAAPELFGTSSRWFDIYETYERLGSSTPTGQLGQTLTSVLAWIVVPGTIGLWRSVHREVK